MIGIEQFKEVLDGVEHQVFSGKGHERHGNGTPLDQQPWYYISKNVGDGFCLGQAMKKIMELRNIPERAKWEREIFGAMAYLVFAVLYKREKAQQLLKNTSSDEILTQQVPFESLKHSGAILSSPHIVDTRCSFVQKE